ncbi:MAG: hypothetical protein KGL35_12165 [Bradyrhizobium sp.]|nr:hypothetical protein [Bradyrhizobium sp.]
MSRTLARQKLESAQMALRCAQSNINEATKELSHESDARIGQRSLGLLSAAADELAYGLREAIELTTFGC